MSEKGDRMEKAETVIFAICDPFGCAQDKFTIDYFSVVSVISVAMTHFEKTNPILRLRSGQVFSFSVLSAAIMNLQKQTQFLKG
jgi:hypothetical protein